MASLIEQANAALPTDPRRAEKIYNQILQSSPCKTCRIAINHGLTLLPPAASDPELLRDQETALVKLGELYRDEKLVLSNIARSGIEVPIGMLRPWQRWYERPERSWRRLQRQRLRN
jgi:hypothetical protein